MKKPMATKHKEPVLWQELLGGIALFTGILIMAFVAGVYQA